MPQRWLWDEMRASESSHRGRCMHGALRLRLEGRCMESPANLQPPCNLRVAPCELCAGGRICTSTAPRRRRWHRSGNCASARSAAQPKCPPPTLCPAYVAASPQPSVYLPKKRVVQLVYASAAKAVRSANYADDPLVRLCSACNDAQKARTRAFGASTRVFRFGARTFHLAENLGQTRPVRLARSAFAGKEQRSNTTLSSLFDAWTAGKLLRVPGSERGFKPGKGIMARPLARPRG